MINRIIAQVEESDRNIYLTIEDGRLVSVNYSQGVNDIDLHFLTTHNSALTKFVLRKFNNMDDNLHSTEFFFPSLYYDKQIKVIDEAISTLIRVENEQAELIGAIEKLELEIDDIRAQIRILNGTYGI